MLNKEDIEDIITNDLVELLTNKMVYKYADLTTGIEDIVLKKSLKFVNPSIFNDPFDCNEYLLKIVLDKEHTKEVIKESIPNVTPELEEKIIEMITDENILAETIQKQKKRYKISCFSKTYDEVLMWSHYGNKHNGVCIGFDFPHVYDNKFMLSNVKYLNELKPLDSKTDTIRVILYWLTTKSERWAYEKEVRAIMKDESEEVYQLIEFDKKHIKEVIFGCNVSDNDINKIIKKLEENNFYDLTFKKMEIDRNSFLLKERIIKASS